jgi:dihydrofolate synthase/folylpolyglutamate synthase
LKPHPEDEAEALAFLAGLAPSGVRLGLDRIHTALRALGNPEGNYPALHVAGTNGKGSTCAFAASCLAEAGYKVGFYSSPHLIRVNERIRINGVEIDDASLGLRILEVLERYPDALDEPAPLTYFELGTVVALWHFARERVDVAVLETGLGGRLDATTAARPSVTAITPISFDHIDYLGNTLAAIAAEKAGIFKAQVPAIVARQAPEALEVLERLAREAGAPLWLEGRDFSFEGGVYKGKSASVPRLKLGLEGAHQQQNAAVALACLERLGERGLPVPPDAIRRGLAATRWPGRFERVAGPPEVILDGAHNPAGVEALLAALDATEKGKRLHLVFGVLADKDHRPMIRALFPRCASVHLTPVDNPRTLEPERYLEEARALCPESHMYASAEEALAGALRNARDASDRVVCTGSLFLIGQLKALLA